MSLSAATDRIGAIQTMIQDLVEPRTTTSGTFGVSGASTVSATGAATATGATTVAGSTAEDFAAALRTAALGSSATADGVASGDDVVARARQYLGVPYVFGGEDATGMDCSGLVQRVFADLGVDVPRVVQDQADVGVEVPSLDQAQPGDLLVVKGEGHIVIYAGDGKIIHAPRPGKDVQLVDNYLSADEISTIRRIVPAGEASSTVGPVADVTATGGSPAQAPEIDAAQLLSVMQTMFASQATGLAQAMPAGGTLTTGLLG
ncbi:C40 family peptidase [Microbacterium marinilacus]|uniref:NlpC/P60 domain-containing protein n=1 Tax=Microbacterium marinilacus TaxID=415209 RepID=A0ABP7B641_9MICO|nr:C40 family peptidase [Microbacterium marinilacus]MBY0687728.1 C40 family peptidase [Microbacterium marinilacus]